MIEVVLISSFFIVSLLIFIIIMVFDIKRWVRQRDDYYMKKHDLLEDEINKLRSIFINEISETLEQVKSILK